MTKEKRVQYDTELESVRNDIAAGELEQKRLEGELINQQNAQQENDQKKIEAERKVDESKIEGENRRENVLNHVD